MTIAKSILGIVPGLQAVTLVGYNLQMAKNAFPKNLAKGKASIKPVKALVNMGVANLVGIGLMKPTVAAISAL